MSMRPVDALFARTRAATLADRTITTAEVGQLKQLFTQESGAAAVQPQLRALLADPAVRFESAEARKQLEALANAVGGTPPRPDNAVFAVRGAPGVNNTRLLDVILKKDGLIQGDTGLKPYSRGWLQFSEKVLTKAHGSPVPPSTIHAAETRARLDNTPVGARLDQAARAFGVQLPAQGFEQVASSKAFADDNAEEWAGVCYAWSWAALDSRLSALVDVDGAENRKGVWVGGQWMSRADLGNWVMAMLAGLSQGAGDVLWYNPEAEDLLKAFMGYLMDGGPGLRVDIGTSYKASNEIWFQPFVGSDVRVGPLSGAPARAILALAAQPTRSPFGTTTPGVQGAAVKRVDLVGHFGNEVGDAHEGAPNISHMRWTAYAVVDQDGKMLKAYMANDPRLANIPGLPTTKSAAVPRELFRPEHDIIDGIMNGDPAAEVRGSVWGPHLNFLVGTVLARGVPAQVRAAFEAEPVMQTTGRLADSALADLAARYPTIANAYSPQEWDRHFAPRGLDRARFGAQTTGAPP